MTDRRQEDPVQSDHEPDQPVPRDPPDQQDLGGEDALDLPHSSSDETEEGEGGRSGKGDDKPDQSLPDADESGAGPTGEPRSGSVHPEQPVPDEPSG
ncbi:hypothetical protein [Streptomyces sp. NBC_00467]|uniref:hypothetical protein n=1 Tax=Streptomyces sp. NBC_00467 TaxID=2975752 RepID=UPI002E1909BC